MPKQVPNKGKSVKGKSSSQHVHGPHVDKYRDQANATRSDRQKYTAHSTGSALPAKNPKKGAQG
jgi:hypothetical protein